jgi:hypothetical protein
MVRLITHHPSDEVMANYGKSGVLESGASEFLLNSERPRGTTAILQIPDQGAGYRDEIECDANARCSMHWFDLGSELAIQDSIEVLGVKIESDPTYPLTFKMTRQGWTLMYGRGKIKPAGNPVIEVGQMEKLDSWLLLLNQKNKLSRESAASALGWIGGESPKRSIIIQALINLLHDTNWEVRRNAAEALGRLKEKAAADPLKKLLDDTDGEGWVKAVAEEALKRIESK